MKLIPTLFIVMSLSVTACSKTSTRLVPVAELPLAPAALSQPAPPLRPLPDRSLASVTNALAEARANDDIWFEKFLGWQEFYSCLRAKLRRSEPVALCSDVVNPGEQGSH